MGARGQNFYTDLASRYGYEREAKEIQDLYLDGNKDEAARLVPRDMLVNTNLVGSKAEVAERVAAYREAGVTHLQVMPMTPDPVKAIDQLRALLCPWSVSCHGVSLSPVPHETLRDTNTPMGTSDEAAEPPEAEGPGDGEGGEGAGGPDPGALGDDLDRVAERLAEDSLDPFVGVGRARSPWPPRRPVRRSSRQPPAVAPASPEPAPCCPCQGRR